MSSPSQGSTKPCRTCMQGLAEHPMSLTHKGQPALLHPKLCLAMLGAPNHPMEGTGMCLRGCRDRDSVCRVGVTFIKHSCPYAFLAGKSRGGWREFATCVRN